MSTNSYLTNKLKVCSAFLLIALGLVMIVFFWTYSGSFLTYPWIGVFAGIAFLIGGFRLLNSIDDSVVTNSKVMTSRHLSSFKENAVKVKVNLDECEILTNNYVKENSPSDYNSVSIFDLFNSNDASNGNQELSQSVIVYKKELNNAIITYYSPVVYKDASTLRFHMGSQKHTYIYINKDNPESYFFDISFLEEDA